MSRIYVASSWRNRYQQSVVQMLRMNGHEVYDFRNPETDEGGFSWTEADPTYVHGSFLPASKLSALLQTPCAQRGFKSDFDAMNWADTVVLVLPCGKSAHLELGWATGAGKRTLILAPEPTEPELMYLQAGPICETTIQLIDALRVTP